MTVGGCLGGVLLLVPAILVVVGLVVFIGSRVLPEIPPPAYPGNTTESLLIAGTLLTAAGVCAAPWLLRAHGALAGLLLGPAGTAELEQRVRHLSRTRTETIHAGAAEIRRIERDLHDGAQARLVAMGMTLDAAGHLIDEDPKAARALPIEARDNSAKALRELRELVRGIHPPVLADRGLAEAIKALALDTPVRIHLTSDLDQAARPSAPIESAAYFAVNELVANVTKHALASQAWIDIRRDNKVLKISAADDGQGGADPAHGSGLRGIEQRLAAFDGVLAVTSLPGGPTAVTLEIPCALPCPLRAVRPVRCRSLRRSCERCGLGLGDLRKVGQRAVAEVFTPDHGAQQQHEGAGVDGEDDHVDSPGVSPLVIRVVVYWPGSCAGMPSRTGRASGDSSGSPPVKNTRRIPAAVIAPIAVSKFPAVRARGLGWMVRSRRVMRGGTSPSLWQNQQPSWQRGVKDTRSCPPRRAKSAPPPPSRGIGRSVTVVIGITSFLDGRAPRLRGRLAPSSSPARQRWQGFSRPAQAVCVPRKNSGDSGSPAVTVCRGALTRSG
jgi:hypothetical protein